MRNRVDDELPPTIWLAPFAKTYLGRRNSDQICIHNSCEKFEKWMEWATVLNRPFYPNLPLLGNQTGAPTTFVTPDECLLGLFIHPRRCGWLITVDAGVLQRSPRDPAVSLIGGTRRTGTHNRSSSVLQQFLGERLFFDPRAGRSLLTRVTRRRAGVATLRLLPQQRLLQLPSVHPADGLGVELLALLPLHLLLLLAMLLDLLGL